MQKFTCERCGRVMYGFFSISEIYCLSCKEIVRQEKKERRKKRIEKHGARDEAKFQTELKQSIDFYNRTNKTDYDYLKDEDGTYSSRGYDFEIWGDNKLVICIESKITKSKNTINFRTLFSNREHEIETLLKKRKQKHQAWVFVNHYNKQEKINDVYIFTPASAKHNDKITIGNTKVFLCKVPRIKDKAYNRYLWDLSILFR